MTLKRLQHPYLFLLSNVCIFVYLLKFGPLLENNYDYLLVTLNLALGFIAAYYVTQLFTQIFVLNTFTKIIIYLLFLIPYIKPPFIGNQILYQSICYPLFIFALGELINGIIHKKYNGLLTSLLSTAVLVLTQKHFIFLYPLIGMILIFTFSKYSHFIGKLWTVITFIGSIIVISLVMRITYQSSPIINSHLIGSQLISAPLFISKKNDAAIFDDLIEKELFTRIHDEMDKRGLLIYHVDGSLYSYYKKYEEAYNTIYYEIINSKLQEVHINDSSMANTMLFKMSFKLIKAHPLTYYRLIKQNIFENMEQNISSLPHIPFFYLLVLAFVVSLLSLIDIFIKSLMVVGPLTSAKIIPIPKVLNSYELLTVSIIILLAQFSNYLSIALIEPVLIRYSIYTDVFTLALLLAIAFMLFIRYEVTKRC